MIKENKRIIFNGNGYADEWPKEAAKRGLLEPTNTVDALPELTKPDVVKIFEKYKVLNARELHARYEVAVETYVKTVNVEAQLMVLMANRYILPAALKYQKRHRRIGGRRQERGRVVEGMQEDARPRHRARRRAEQRTDRLADALEAHAPISRKTRDATCATRSCRRWRRCVTRAIRSNCSCRTKSGRCQRTERCYLSSEAHFNRAIDLSRY